MRELDPNLETAQKASILEPAIIITLSHTGDDDVTLGTDRIKSIPLHLEEPLRMNATVLLDNSDGYFTEKDVKGWQADFSWGLNTEAGKKYSNTAPLWVRYQEVSWIPGKLTCELRMVGIPDMLAEDRASDAYTPDAEDTKTVRTLFREIAGDTGVTHLACFNHCRKYDVVFDSVDGLIDTYKPKDSFRIRTNDIRLGRMRRLLDYTKCMMRFGNDGKIHILQPTISTSTAWKASTAYNLRDNVIPITPNDYQYICTTAGTSGETEPTWTTGIGDTINDGSVVWTVAYDYKYSLSSGHAFFAKAYRKTLVIPNYIVVESQKDDDPQYAPGFAKDQDSIDSLKTDTFNGEVRQYYKIRLENDDQAGDISEAVLSKYQLNAEMGAAEVPMNCGSELYDFVKVNKVNSEDEYRIGNLGSITRIYNPEEEIYNMRFSFGGWLTVRGISANLEVYPDGISQRIDENTWFVENLYAHYIYSQMLDVEYLSAITANMGLLTAGEIRIGTGVLEPTGTATGGSQTTVEDTGASWTPDEWFGEDIRVVIGGTAYTRTITGNTETIITFNALPDGVAVSEGDSYYLGKVSVAAGDGYWLEGFGTGVATGGSTTALIDSGQDWDTNDYKNKHLRIIKNGLWYERKVISNTDDTLTFAELPAYEPFTGFRLWTDGVLGRIAGYKDGVIQYYTGSDGYLYAGGGDVIINEWGIRLYGDHLVFYDTNDTYRGSIFGHTDGYLQLFTPGTQYVRAKRLHAVYRLRIPVGTDMFD